MVPHTQHQNLPDAGQVPHTLLDLRPPALWHRLRTTQLTAASNTIALEHLPKGYNQWRLVVLARSTAAAEGDAWTMTFNGDTAANYDLIRRALTIVSLLRAASNLDLGLSEGATARANVLAPTDITFYRPTDTTWEKAGRFESSRMGDRSASGDLLFQHGTFAWRSTAAIHTITLTMTAGDFDAGSSAALWGLRLA